MPTIEDLPQIVQDQIRVRNGAAPAHVGQQNEQHRRKTLLEKLAAFGISRHEEAPPPPRAPLGPNLTQVNPAPAALTDYGRPAQRPAGQRPAQGQLATRGRVAGLRPQPSDEDQLEIPAFLRRQPSA